MSCRRHRRQKRVFRFLACRSDAGSLKRLRSGRTGRSPRYFWACTGALSTWSGRRRRRTDTPKDLFFRLTSSSCPCAFRRRQAQSALRQDVIVLPAMDYIMPLTALSTPKVTCGGASVQKSQEGQPSLPPETCAKARPRHSQGSAVRFLQAGRKPPG